MDNKELTKIFWKNVEIKKKKLKLTWEDLEKATGHSARSISTMKTMNKAPSFHFALALAKALDTTIEELSTESAENDKRTINDVLYKICSNLSENDVYILACTAQSLKEAKNSTDYQSIDDEIEKMKDLYL